MKNSLTRRGFIRTAAAGSVALGWLGARRAPSVFAAEAAKPALLGGTPVHKGGWAKWPQWREAWEPEVLKVLRSGRWFRGSDEHVAEFERGYAQLLGAKTLPGHRQRHHGADRQPARHGRGRRRRGDRLALHVHRQLQRDPHAARPCRCSPTPTRPRSPWTRPRSRAASPSARAPSCRCTSSACRATWTRSTPSPASTSWPWSRMPARRGWRNTRAASAARSATWAASASRNPSTFPPAKAAPSPA